MRRLVCLFAAALIAAVAPAAAQGPGAPQAVTHVALIDGWRQPDGTHIAAIEIGLAPGWHTYWRAPGGAGIPPVFDWSGSGNLAAVAYEWPRPEIFRSFGAPTLGYSRELVLPVRLTPRDEDAPIAAAVDLQFGVCADICVPAAARVVANLFSGSAPDGDARIAAALERRAVGPEEAGVAGVACRLEPMGDDLEVTAEVTFSGPVPEQFAVLEPGLPGIWVGTPEVRTEGRRVVARAKMEGADGHWLERGALRLTLLDADRAVDIRGCPQPG